MAEDWGYEGIPQGVPSVMPSQPTQAVMPVGGIPQAPMPDFFTPARAQVSQSQDMQDSETLSKRMYGKALKLQDSLDKLETATNSDGIPMDAIKEYQDINNELAQTAGALRAIKPAAFSFLPGGNHRNEVNYASQVAGLSHRQQTLNARREAIKSMVELYNQTGDQGLKLMSESHNRYKDVLDTAESFRKAQQGEEIQSRLTAAQQENADLRRQALELQKQGVDIRQFLAPHTAAALDASAGLRGVQAQTGQAALPFAAPQAAAKLSLTRNNAAAVAPRTSAMMAGATGGMPNRASMQSAGMMVPPPPPTEATAAGAQPGGMDTGAIQLNPKAQAAIEHTNATTAATSVKTEKETIALQRRAENTVKAMVASNPEKGKADYWKSHPDEYKRLVEQTPHIAERLIRYLKEGK